MDILRLPGFFIYIKIVSSLAILSMIFFHNLGVQMSYQLIFVFSEKKMQRDG